MRIAAIKELVSRYSIDELIQAEEAFEEREPPSINQTIRVISSHTSVGLWIFYEMSREQIPVRCVFTQRAQQHI